MKLQLPNHEELWIDEGVFVRELVNCADCPAFSLAICRLPGQLTTQLHRLSVDEWYLIEQGTATMSVGGALFDVTVGDVIEVKGGIAQSIRNLLDADLVFQVICMPRFTMDCYEALE